MYWEETFLEMLSQLDFIYNYLLNIDRPSTQIYLAKWRMKLWRASVRKTVSYERRATFNKYINAMNE